MELVVESGPDAGKIFQVGPAMLVAGRQFGVDILLNDDQISRRHASFEAVNNVLLLNDLGSANGTRLNGRTIDANQPMSLSPGDRIQIGRTTLVVRGLEVVKDEPTLTELAGAFPANNPYGSQAPAAYPGHRPDQPLNDPSAAYYQDQNPGYYQPNQAQPYPGGPHNIPPVQAPIPAPTPYYQNVPPAAPAARKSNSGPILAGIAGILVVAILAIGAILLIDGNKPGSGDQRSTSTPETPVAIVPNMQTIVGPNGSNALPPAPPASTGGTAPTPNASGQGTRSLGISIVYPTGWKTTVDEGQNSIESYAPDGITFSLVHRLSGLKGTPAERLTAYLRGIEENIDGYKLTRPVQAASSDNTIADAYITYSLNDGKLKQRDYIVATANTAGDTYFIHFSSEDASFESQINTFNSILKSIAIN